MVQHRSRSHPGGPGAGGGQQSTTVHNVYTGHQVTTDQGLVTMCQCSTFLDPYPTGQTAQWRSMVGTVPLSAALQHYCRVCNTQLNSCKQARIHVAGKKHEKRLAYLKFSLETSEAVNNSYTTASVGQYHAPNNGGVAMSQPPMSSALPTVYAYPPPCGGYAPAPPQPHPPSAAYYFPPSVPTQAMAPPPQYPSQHAPTPHGIYGHYDQPQTSQPPTSVSAAVSLNHYPTPHGNPHSHPPHVNHSNITNRRGKTTAGGATAASHGVMSPSLTSGFSGSGDCKSTETCSLLSVASYSSATPTSHAHVNGGHNKHGAEQQSSATHVSNRHVVTCEVCHLPFPSRAVLEHHLMGSRHARKVKAESVLRQLQENGAEFRATEATGDIRCEVCEVSVNSSHQLQAHMTGHKHKMRCARQGVAPNKTILTPASSTAPSTTPSEASAPVRSYSILVGRPQFGSRPNLYKTTAGARGGRSGASHGDVADRHRSRVSSGLSKLGVSKSRKVVRPRLKTELSSRQFRILTKGGSDLVRSGGVVGGGAADSTTESDEPGNSKQKSPIVVAKKTETNLVDKEEHVEDEAEYSDEAKESEADQDSSNTSSQAQSASSSGSGSSGPSSESNSCEQRLQPRFSVNNNNNNNNNNNISVSGVSQITKASQTEPLRRLSVDDCDLMLTSSSTTSPVKNQDQEQKEEKVKESAPASSCKEPRRRSVSASYSGQALVQSTSTSSNNNYHCNLCQISVNSQSQLAQHMNSNKHRRLSVALQSHMTGGQTSVSGGRSSKVWYQGEITKESLSQPQTHGGHRECNVREIPMLSMFLQRLHQHHYFPPIRDDEDGSAETHR